jgi:hypothetical protein
MNYYHILGNLNDQLENLLKIYFTLVRDTTKLTSRKLNENIEKIKATMKVYKKQIEKSKILQ